MREANTAIQREHHITPTIHDVIHEPNEATVSSKLNLTAGYHQLEHHPASRYITTFTTHQGLRPYKRLNFGILPAAEVSGRHYKVSSVSKTCDNIIVHG